MGSAGFRPHLDRIRGTIDLIDPVHLENQFYKEPAKASVSGVTGISAGRLAAGNANSMGD